MRLYPLACLIAAGCSAASESERDVWKDNVWLDCAGEVKQTFTRRGDELFELNERVAARYSWDAVNRRLAVVWSDGKSSIVCQGTGVDGCNIDGELLSAVKADCETYENGPLEVQECRGESIELTLKGAIHQFDHDAGIPTGWEGMEVIENRHNTARLSCKSLGADERIPAPNLPTQLVSKRD